MCSTERLSAFLASRIQDGPVCQDNSHGTDYPVAVGMGAAIHSGCVVGDYASDHGRRHRGGIRGEFLPVRFQDLVYTVSHDPGLQGDGFPVVVYLVFIPACCGNKQYALGKALSGKACSCCTEGYGNFLVVTYFYDPGNFLFCFRKKYGFWNFPVKTGVGSPGQAMQVISMNAFRRKGSGKRVFRFHK